MSGFEPTLVSDGYKHAYMDNHEFLGSFWLKPQAQ